MRGGEERGGGGGGKKGRLWWISGGAGVTHGEVRDRNLARCRDDAVNSFKHDLLKLRTLRD